MKILITERQLKILLSEAEIEEKGKKKKKKEGGSDDYIVDQELEEVVIVYDRKTGEVTGKVADWEYVGSKGRRKRKRSYWVAKGIDIGGMRNKINKFAKIYSQYMSDNIDTHVGPVITSGYRGAKRQVNAIWDQWLGDKKYLNLYKSEYGNPIEKIFKDNEDNPKQAKKLATDFLKEKEKDGR